MKVSKTFVLEKNNNRPNEMRIRMRVRWNGKVAQFLIPFTVNPDKWNKATNRCVANTTQGKDKVSASEINRTVQIYEDAADDISYNYLYPSESKIQFNVVVTRVDKALS